MGKLNHAIVCVLLAFLYVHASAQPDMKKYQSHKTKADSLYYKKEYAGALLELENALNYYTQNYYDWYDAACYASLGGNYPKAFQYLKEAIGKGLMNKDKVQNDKDLFALHADTKRWEQIIAALDQKIAAYESRFDQKLRDRLKAIYKRDLMFRQYGDSVYRAHNAEQDSIDRLNQAEIKEIIQQYGYPGTTVAGSDLNSVAFKVIQHSNLQFQQQYYDTLIAAAGRGDLSKSSLALFIDRYNLAVGKKQVYGSQVKRNENGQYVVLPIEDEANVEQRRKEAGLEPLKQYLMRWGIQYGN